MKDKVPSSKLQIPNKLQITSSKVGYRCEMVESLELGIYLELGAWSLELF